MKYFFYKQPLLHNHFDVDTSHCNTKKMQYLRPGDHEARLHLEWEQAQRLEGEVRGEHVVRMTRIVHIMRQTELFFLDTHLEAAAAPEDIFPELDDPEHPAFRRIMRDIASYALLFQKNLMGTSAKIRFQSALVLTLVVSKYAKRGGLIELCACESPDEFRVSAQFEGVMTKLYSLARPLLVQLRRNRTAVEAKLLQRANAFSIMGTSSEEIESARRLSDELNDILRNPLSSSGNAPCHYSLMFKMSFAPRLLRFGERSF
jgi:hypothetical protein